MSIRFARPAIAQTCAHHGDLMPSLACQIRSYHVPILGNASVEAVSKQIARHIPTHKPLWTCVEVGALAEPEMKIEIEIEAHIPPSTKSV